jgi:hypothetical protein
MGGFANRNKKKRAPMGRSSFSSNSPSFETRGL